MTNIPIPQDFEVWAAHQVAAGRAATVAEIAIEALQEFRVKRHEQELAAFRKTLDEARQEIVDGNGVPAEVVFAEVRARRRVRAKA